MLFSIVTVSIYIPPSSARGLSLFLFSTASPAFVVSKFLDDGHSDWYDIHMADSLLCTIKTSTMM